VARRDVGEQLREESAEPTALVPVENGHRELGDRGIAVIADVAGDRDAGGTGLVDGEGGPGEVCAVIEVGQVVEDVLAESVRRAEESPATGCR
jgi:hypothetical protein